VAHGWAAGRDEASLDLGGQVTKMKNSDAQRLQDEYQRLVRGLAESGVIANAAAPDAALANPGILNLSLKRCKPYVSCCC